MINEEWRGYPGFEDVLEVSNLGRVRRKARLSWDKKVIPAKIINGKFNTISTSINSVKMTLRIKEAVARAFIPVPAGCDFNKLMVISIDGSHNYCVENLKYIPFVEFEAQTKKEEKPKVIKTIKPSPEAIYQMRKDGSVVRRYIDIDEVLEVHPLWNKVELLTALTEFLPEAYGYKWKYEVER